MTANASRTERCIMMDVDKKKVGYAGEALACAVTLPRFSGQLTYMLESVGSDPSSKSTGLRKPSFECRRLRL